MTPDAGAADDADDAFWLPIEEVHWDGTPVRDTPDQPPEGHADNRRVHRRRGRPVNRQPRRPLPAMAALVALSLISSFFAWVSAEPFWLAVGHAQAGTVVIGSCVGTNLAQRCRGDFTTANQRHTAYGVRVAGVPAKQRTAGSTLPARMVGDGDTAYVDSAGPIRHLRWSLGLALVLLCAAGIAWATGASHLTGPWRRRIATVAGFSGPLLLTLGFLVAAF